MDIDPNKGGWLSRITKTVTSTVKEIGSILTSDDDTPPTTQSKPATGYMAQFDAVLNKELNPNAPSPYSQQVTSPTHAYPPYDPHHTQPHGYAPYDQSQAYQQQQQHGYQQPPQPQLQPPPSQQPPYGTSSSSFPTPNNNTSTDPSQYPPYMYASLQSQQGATPASTYSTVPPSTFPSQTPSSFTPTPSTSTSTTPSFTPFIPQPVISPAVSPSHTATAAPTSIPSTSTPAYLQPPFSPLPTVSSPSHATSQPVTYTGYTHGTAYPEQPAYMDSGYQQTNAYTNDYYAQAQPGYQAPTISQQQQQQGPLPPPPVSNYWKERAAVAPPPTAAIIEPHKVGSAPRVDYSDLDPRSMDFVYSDRKYN